MSISSKSTLTEWLGDTDMLDIGGYMTHKKLIYEVRDDKEEKLDL